MKSFPALRLISLVALVVVMPISLKAAPDEATIPQSNEEVHQLFDGRTLQGWGKYKSKEIPISQAWTIERGSIHRDVQRAPRVGHIYWAMQEFGDFELSWKWKIAPGGNSGVKYRVTLELFRRSTR